MKSVFDSLKRIVFAFSVGLLASCSTSQLELFGFKAPEPTILISNPQFTLSLMETDSKPNLTSRCWLHFRFENKSNYELKPQFRLLMLDAAHNSLKEDVLSFPTILPNKSYVGVHYTFTDWTCERIAALRVTPLF